MTPQPLNDEQRQQVEEHLDIVRKAIVGLGVPAERQADAMQDGVFGLARAVQLYDESQAKARGVAFTTYARRWVQKAAVDGYERERGLNFRMSGSSRRETSRTGQRPQYRAPVSLDPILPMIEGLDGDYPGLVDTVEAALADTVDVEGEAIGKVVFDDVLDGEAAYADLLLNDRTKADMAREAGVSVEAYYQRMSKVRRRLAARLAAKGLDPAMDDAA